MWAPIAQRGGEIQPKAGEPLGNALRAWTIE